MAVDLLPPSDEAVAHVADLLRLADRQELEAARGLSMDDAVVRRKTLRAAVLASQGGECFAAHCARTGEPVAVLGVAPAGWVSDEAAPWLLGTERVGEFGRDLVFLGRAAVASWSEQWSLANYVDARNLSAVRWLRRIGFTLEPAAAHGAAGLPFHRFVLPRSSARG